MIAQTAVPRWVENLAMKLITFRVPRHLSDRFKSVDSNGLSVVEASLRRHYFCPENSLVYSDKDYLSTPEGQEDLQQHLHLRLAMFRSRVIPWLSNARSLDRANILEIGCGTGSSTVALAEQGATVTGVDVLERSLAVATDRCRVYGVDATFSIANATKVHERFAGRPFDFIIFFASFEHLTNRERLLALRNTWAMLPKGGLLCVIEAPNRLWFADYHTSDLPFFNWLPDDLAFLYSRFSPRKPFCTLFKEEEVNDQRELEFLRLGRGVSYHEFDLAIKKVENLDVVSSMPLFLRARSLALRLFWRLLAESRYEALLMKVGPRIHRGFYQRSLDLIIRKD
jgi:S-adenosylmethionine-dependent methyltransferase